MNTLNSIEPKKVWTYFQEICKVPRPSKKEEKIIKFLLDFGKKHNLETKRDAVGNVLISKPATKGYENKKAVILQSHVDMVCEKNSEVSHDFDKDPIKPYIDKGWIKAEGTTLGADDGIGVAAQMAILTSDEIKHGPIECLFTVDEETGLTGAFELQSDFFKAKTLINLDSEDEGELFIGCAGGIDTIAYFDYEREKAEEAMLTANVSLTGLKGGHSGDDICKGRGNAVKLLNRFLYDAQEELGAKLIHFDGGNLRNAIAREAFASFAFPENKAEELKHLFETFTNNIKNEFPKTEPDIKTKIEISNCEKGTELISEGLQKRLIGAIYACPHGVFSWSQAVDNLVETSTNLASVKFEEDRICITTSQRSSLKSGKKNMANMVKNVFILAGSKVRHTDGYPGWQPKTDSEILKITETSYNNLFGKKPIVRAIHAGLECGLFLEKYPDLDMISFGPTIRGAHSPDERINIETTEKFWKLLIDVLEKIAEK